MGTLTVSAPPQLSRSSFRPRLRRAHPAGYSFIDVKSPQKEIPVSTLRLCKSHWPVLALLLLATIFAPLGLPGQPASVATAPPPSTGGFFPLSQVHRGLHATAWTVFQGTKPEPMDVEILGVLRGARGPGQDMILAQLRGAKPEYTGVVAGMSGSPVYVGKQLLGSLSFRIGQFSKDPIAGITPIKDMLEVRDLPIRAAGSANSESTFPGKDLKSDASSPATPTAPFQAMETPLVMSGFNPEAIHLWQQRMAGTGLEMVTAGGVGGSSAPESKILPSAETIEPGSAVSAQLVRGDMEIAATCTVTYVDPKQLLACGHPILQAGPVSLPMTITEVVATLASPLNAFKIVNTGATIGAFTQDRESAIRGVFGARARMIPVHIAVQGPLGSKQINVEVLDQPSLTPQALLITLYNALLQSNQSTADTSYHLTGAIDLDDYSPVPLDLWASASDTGSSSLQLALLTADRFARLYSNDGREGGVRQLDLRVKVIPHRVQMQLEAARIISGDMMHAGDTVTVEATLRPWQQPEQNVRIPIRLPARLQEGNVRILVSDGGTLDRTLNQPRLGSQESSMNSVLAEARSQHATDRVYVTLLIPEAQADLDGQALTSLPLSMVNALEPRRTVQDITLNGESAELAGEARTGGTVSGFQILNLHVESGSGLH